MPCHPEKKNPLPLPPLYYSWSAATPCRPKNSLKCEHKCFQPDDAKDFVKLNKEAIAGHRRKYLERAKITDVRPKSCMSQSSSSKKPF